MKTGVVKFFNKDKGFGFIVSDNDKSEIFVHATGVSDGYSINKGDKVRYATFDGKKGIQAKNVSVIYEN